MDAAKSETLEEHQRMRAKMLGKIAGYYAQLNRNDRAGTARLLTGNTGKILQN